MLPSSLKGSGTAIAVMPELIGHNPGGSSIHHLEGVDILFLVGVTHTGIVF